jgi:hypothetical protein
MSTLVKYGLMTVAILGALFGVYSYGHSNGYDSGHTAGWNEQQKTIQKMVDQQNAQTTAQNARISDLEQKAMKAAGDIFTANAKAASTRASVVTKYQLLVPDVVTKSCGWDEATVSAINEIIDADPVNAAANAYEAAHPDEASAPTGVTK